LEGFLGEMLPIILLFAVAFTIRFMGGAWETKCDSDAYIARQAEHIYSLRESLRVCSRPSLIS
jgi:hypothetical protein